MFSKVAVFFQWVDSLKQSLISIDQNEDVNQELSEAMTLLKNLERKLYEVQGQRDLAQQECAGHIEHIHTLKESNFKLTEGLEEAVSKAELYKGR